MEVQKENIRLHSDELDQVMSSVPLSIIRIGSGLLLLLLLLLLALGIWIEYPDVLRGDAIVSTLQSPVRMRTESEGRLLFLIEDKQAVKVGDTLAYLDNQADFLTIQSLITQVKTDTFGIKNIYFSQHKNKSIRLGELQSSFQAWQKSCKELLYFQQNQRSSKDVAQIQKQLDTYKNIVQNLQKQYQLTKNETKLSAQTFGIDSILFVQSVIPTKEIFEKEKSYLQAKKTLVGTESSLFQNNLQVVNLENQLQTIPLNAEEKLQTLVLNVLSAWSSLQIDFSNWQKKYVLIAAISGQLSYMNYDKKGQFMKQGQDVLAILPADTEFICFVNMNSEGIGKVEVGQDVFIRLHNFPAHEYGRLKGKVIAITLIGQEKSKEENKRMYQVKVDLYQKLKTDNHKIIKNSPEMTGEAEIITKPRSFLSRLLSFGGVSF